MLIGGSLFAQAASSPLRLVLDSHNFVYKQGEAIHWVVSLRNVGDRELSLFHPTLFGECWREWGFTVRVRKSGHREKVIRPRIVFARVPQPEERHFRTLAPGEAIDIRLFFPGKDSKQTGMGSEWSAMLPISRFDAERLPETWLRWKYQFQGGFNYVSTGDGQEYVELHDIVGDVFGVPGRYRLDFYYVNRYDHYLVPDTQRKYLVPKKLPGVWTGELVRTITLEIKRR